MLKRLKIPLSLGMAAYGIAYLIVKTYGYNSETFMLISYLYIALAAIIGLRYEIGRIGDSSLISALKNVVIVVEGEELKMKRLLTGEKYKLKGEVEKLQ